MSWLTSRYETIVRSLENKHHFPWVLATGCCAHEIQNIKYSTYDWQRLGVDDVAQDPTQSNLLFIAGWINIQRAEEIRRTYERMQKPTSVIALGACALSGSPYDTLESNPRIIRAADLVPVDVNVVGCPPRPEAILAAILELQKKLKPGPSATEVLQRALRDKGTPMSPGPSAPVNVNFNELSGVLKEVMNEKGAETFLGAMTTTKGILVLLFSNRLNMDFSILVPGTDSSKVLAKVFEVLAQEGRDHGSH